MKPIVTRLARLGALVPLAVAAHAATARAQQPFDTSAWNISAAEWRVESYRGRSALLLRDGAAWLRGSRFQNGTIEFDVAFSERERVSRHRVPRRARTPTSSCSTCART